MAEVIKNQKRVWSGVVISDKMDKTIVVGTERTFRHQLLGKTMRSTKNYKVHDESGQAKVGDLVEFYEGRPISKTKYMYLGRIIKHNAVNGQDN
jgi:small subunit ribosomal protein S17